MKTTVWILGDQLNPRISALAGLDVDQCTVLMIESFPRARRLPFHKQKLTFVWSAMRHFAQELREFGYTVDYYQAQSSLKSALEAHIREYEPSRLRIMETAEYGRSRRLARWIARATSSLPTPLSPVMSTGLLLSATAST